MFTIHVVSHTHWDREWYLAFQRFRFRLVELIDHLLALLEADPDYRSFMLDGQMIVLEDYLEIRPEREAQIRRYVQEGRLLIGPWYILPDEFLVSPEATVRNLLVGGQVCRRFGPRMGIGYIPDPFGHVGQMPQILRGIGIDVACLWRGVGEQPTELCWRAPDGSEVLLLHLRDSYSNGGWLPDDEDGFAQALAELRDSLAPHGRARGTYPWGSVPRAVHVPLQPHRPQGGLPPDARAGLRVPDRPARAACRGPARLACRA